MGEMVRGKFGGEREISPFDAKGKVLKYPGNGRKALESEKLPPVISIAVARFEEEFIKKLPEMIKAIRSEKIEPISFLTELGRKEEELEGAISESALLGEPGGEDMQTAKKYADILKSFQFSGTSSAVRLMADLNAKSLSRDR